MPSKKDKSKDANFSVQPVASNEYDVIIVGAGAAGIGTAYSPNPTQLKAGGFLASVVFP